VLIVGVVDAVTFPTTQDACNGTVLDPGATCTISVRFSPSSSGAKSTALHVGATPGGTATVNLTGTAVDPGALAIAPQSRDFGSVPQGQSSAEQTFQVSNTGGAPTSALAMALTGSDAGEFGLSTDACSGHILGPGENCTIGVKLSPAASGAVGAKNATLSASATTGGTAVASLSGVALGPAALRVVPTDQDFGMVAQGMPSQEFTFMVTNGGGLASGALVTGISPAGEFAITTNGCDGKVLVPGATCSIGIKMTPAGSGQRSASLTVRGSPGGAAVANLRGTGLAPGMIVLAPSPQDFGIVNVGFSSNASLTVTNTGGSPTTALSLVTAGAAEFSVSNDTCSGQTLGAGARCSFSVAFAPTTFGARSGSVTVSATTGGSATSSLSGTGRDYVSLTVTKIGTGGGTVAASGLLCAGSSCAGNYARTDPAAFQRVDLSAAPDAYSVFTGWGGAGCTGTGGCSVTMDTAKSVTATFTTKTVKITVNNVGLSGQSGVIMSSDGSVTCPGGTCGPVDHAAAPSFTLKAVPNGTFSFIGWSGACKGISQTCTLSLTSDVQATATFGPPVYMFVTSSLVIPGRLFGVAGADTECMNRASAAGLPGTYHAWISAAGTDANARVGSGGWVRTDGRPFASGIAALKNKINQQVFYPARVDENGNDLGPAHIVAATGGNNDGSNFGDQCTNYTSTAGSLYVGVASAGTQYWSYSYLDSQGCMSPAHLYCFRTDLSAPIMPPPPPGPVRRIFTSALPFTPGGGLTAADAQCQLDAKAAGFPNWATFVALMATSGAPAISRVNLTGPPWRRPDQVLVVANAADLAAGNLLAPIDLTADGMTYAARAAWTGAMDVGSKASDGYACNDWTIATSGASSYFGYTDFAITPDWFNSGRLTCDTVNVYLTCLEP